MKMKPDDEVQELISYVNWYGGFKCESKATAWMDENLAGWRTVRNTKISFEERIGED